MAVPEGATIYDLKISGYLGGHSGVEINQYRASAIKQMARVLRQVGKMARIISIKGGQAHNAIPAIAEAKLAVFGCQDCLEKKVQEIFQQVHQAFSMKEKAAKIELVKVDAKVEKSFSDADTAKIVAFLLNAPHGPVRFSQEVKDFVETSFTTATISTEGNKISILGSGRSCYEQEIDYLYQQC